MMANIDYKYVKIGQIPYEPKRIKKRQTALQRVGRAIMCGASKTAVERSEALLRDYDRVRYKVALLVRGVAKAGNAICIDDEKETFCVAEEQKLHREIIALYDDFKKKRRCVSLSLVTVVAFFTLGAFGGMFPAFADEDVASLFVATVLCAILFTVIASFISFSIMAVNATVGRQLKDVKKEKCTRYFHAVCNSLKFVGKKAEKFAYKIEKIGKHDAEIAYFFAEQFVGEIEKELLY